MNTCIASVGPFSDMTMHIPASHRIYGIYSHLSQLNMLPNTSTPTFMLSSRLGMETTAHSNGNKRKERQTITGREGLLWASVEILKDHSTSPNLKCNYCGHTYCGGATRIKNHIINVCTCDTEEFCELKEKITNEQEDKQADASRKVAAREADAQSELPEVKPEVKPVKKGAQSTIRARGRRTRKAAGALTGGVTRRARVPPGRATGGMLDV